jgi:hypothetical protein
MKLNCGEQMSGGAHEDRSPRHPYARRDADGTPKAVDEKARPVPLAATAETAATGAMFNSLSSTLPVAKATAG